MDSKENILNSVLSKIANRNKDLPATKVNVNSSLPSIANFAPLWEEYTDPSRLLSDELCH